MRNILSFDQESSILYFDALKGYVERVWAEFRFPPSGGESIGRSRLSEQIADISNYEIRDCKLPAYIVAMGLRQAGISLLLVTSACSVHPRVLTPQFESVARFVDSPVTEIDFFPKQPGFTPFILDNGRRVYWSDVMDPVFRNKYRLKVHEFDENGAPTLDEAYEERRWRESVEV